MFRSRTAAIGCLAPVGMGLRKSDVFLAEVMDAIEIKPDAPRSWQSAEIPGLELSGGTYRDQDVPRHTHDALMVAVAVEGAPLLRHRGINHVVSAGLIAAISPGEAHSGVARGTAIRLEVPWPVLLQFLSRRAAHECFASDPIIDDSDLVRRFISAYTAFEGDATRLEREEKLNDAIAAFFVRHARPRAILPKVGFEWRAIDRAQEFLSGSLDRNVSLEELASAAGLSGFQLTRAFTREIGMPPHAWHRQSRLRAAQRRLARGERVIDVALDCGFADQAHFTRHFKRLTGVAPGRYRAEHLGRRLQGAT